jgi:hypothetical protein
MLRPSKQPDPTPEQLESWLESRLCRKNVLWTDRRQRGAWRYYCPFCSVSRALRMAPRPGWKHFGQILLTTLVFTAALWPVLGGAGLFLLLPFWILFEVFYRLKVRAELQCEYCGFDPTLFLADAERAKAEMKAFWEKKLGKSATGGPASEGASGDSLQDSNPSLTAEKTES